MQFCEVEAEYEPGEQLKHSEKPEPVAYQPALQLEHFVELLLGEKEPGEHKEQMEEPSSEYVLGRHARQAAAVVIPKAGWYLPALHSVQLTVAL